MEPVLANTTSASATLAQLPVFDAADAAAKTQTSPRMRLTITCPRAKQRLRTPH